MKKIITAFFSLVGLSFLISCRNKVVFSTEASGKSLLWEISGNGLNKPSYFLGTMHLMCADDALISKNVKAIIQQTDMVFFEMDIDNASELLSGFFDLSAHRDKSLEDVLSEEEYLRVRSFFEKFNPAVPFTVLERQPPMMLSSLVYELLLPCEQKNGIEMKIIDEAYKQKKETKGLESMAFQAGIFDSIPFNEQAKDLLHSIDSIETGRKMITEMMKVYREQDVEKLSEMSISEDNSLSSHADLLLYKRNINWVNQFRGLTSKNAILFAVGAGHLGGEKGVLHLLKKQGYTVRPIQN